MELADYWTLDPGEDERIVHVCRTSYPYPDLQVVVPSFEALLNALKALEPGDKALMIDFRRGPTPRNDEAFESLSRPYRTKLFQCFAAGGVLVRTAAGMMQLTRTSREDGSAYAVHSHEAELRAYLLQELESR